MQYYIIVNEKQVGPFQKEELLINGLTRDSLVWRTGLTDWTPAHSLEELADILAEESAFGAYAQVEEPIEVEPESNGILYYAMINDKPVGPLPIDKLIEMGLMRATDVWCEEMPGWAPAYTRADIVNALNTVPQRPHAQPQAQPFTGGIPPYNRPYNSQGASYSTNPYQGQHQQGQPYQGYNQDQPSNNQFIPHTDWLPWAIVATILGFFTSCIGGILGIIAIVYANKANSAYNMGDEYAGENANGSAKTLTIIAFVLIGIGLFVTLSMFSTFANFL